THTLQELKLATELTLSAYKGTSETPENEAHITVQKCAEFGVSTTLNADLLMAAGSELKMHGTVSMGSNLTIQAGVMLTGAQYEALGGLINDGVSKVVLFEGIDTLYLGTEAQTESITLKDQLLASTYFSNLENTDYLLVYDASESGNGILSIMVPEPASSTLSLLALAAMVARRRRRK
ncbi:MAG: PEP-CTERM sorting domain-containing protein, partial [Akkermansia sp.]|nr:PEP-CTERM sorting domain-containing protein [Akkermansia sp.]